MKHVKKTLEYAGKVPNEAAALAIADALAKGLPVPGSGDELQRTVYVGNLDPTTSSDMIIQYFGKVRVFIKLKPLN